MSMRSVLIAVLLVSSLFAGVLASQYDLVPYDGEPEYIPNAGPWGPAVDLNGAYYLGAAFDNFVWGDTFTVALWYQQVVAVGDCAIIANDWHDTKSFYISADSSGTIHSFLHTDSCPIDQTPCVRSLALPGGKGVWNHFAIVYNSTDRLTYINGGFVDSFSQTGSLVPSAQPLILGTTDFGASCQGTDPQFGDVRLYSRALSAAEIGALANPAKGVPYTVNDNLTALYDFTDPQTLGADHSATVCHQPLEVRGIAPSTGPLTGGFSLTLTGLGFSAPAPLFLYLGAVAAAAATNITDTSALVVVPPGLVCGALPLLVRQGPCVSALVAGMFTATGSTVLGVQPLVLSPAGGVYVTVTMDCALTPPTITPLCRWDAASTMAGRTLSATTVLCPAAPHVEGVAALTVSLDGGFSFTGPSPVYYYNDPMLATISPAVVSDYGGQVVVLAGDGLALDPALGMPAICLVNGVASAATVLEFPTSVSCAVPRLRPGSYSVAVAVGNRTSNVVPLTVAGGSADPQQTSVTGDLCLGGCPPCQRAIATITAADAAGFDAPLLFAHLQISFSPADAMQWSYEREDNSSLRVEYEAANVGVFNLTVQLDGEHVRGSPFTVAITEPALVITQVVNPYSVIGYSSTGITVMGSGFVSCSQAAPACGFGAAGFAPAQVVSPEELICIVPTTVAPGSFALQVYMAGEMLVATSTFTVFNGPTVTDVSPRGGPLGGGISITLSGSGFAAVPSAAAPQCRFLVWTSPAVIVDDHTVICALPPAANAGPVPVSFHLDSGFEAYAQGTFQYGSSCPNNCAGRGACTTDGLCVCNFGYSGADCSTPVVIIFGTLAGVLGGVALVLAGVLVWSRRQMTTIQTTERRRLLVGDT
jgi:hypothetical protein